MSAAPSEKSSPVPCAAEFGRTTDRSFYPLATTVTTVTLHNVESPSGLRHEHVADFANYDIFHKFSPVEGGQFSARLFPSDPSPGSPTSLIANKLGGAYPHSAITGNSSSSFYAVFMNHYAYSVVNLTSRRFERVCIRNQEPPAGYPLQCQPLLRIRPIVRIPNRPTCFAGAGPVLELWDASSGEMLGRRSPPSGFGFFDCCELGPGGKQSQWLAYCGYGDFYVCDIEENLRIVKTLYHQGNTILLLSKPSLDMFVSSNSSTMRFWDVKTLDTEPVKETKCLGYNLCNVPETPYFLTLSGDNLIKIWDCRNVESETPVSTMISPCKTGVPRSCHPLGPEWILLDSAADDETMRQYSLVHLDGFRLESTESVLIPQSEGSETIGVFGNSDYLDDPVYEMELLNARLDFLMVACHAGWCFPLRIVLMEDAELFVATIWL